MASSWHTDYRTENRLLIRLLDQKLYKIQVGEIGGQIQSGFPYIAL